MALNVDGRIKRLFQSGLEKSTRTRHEKSVFSPTCRFCLARYRMRMARRSEFSSAGCCCSWRIADFAMAPARHGLVGFAADELWSCAGSRVVQYRAGKCAGPSSSGTACCDSNCQGLCSRRGAGVESDGFGRVYYLPGVDLARVNYLPTTLIATAVALMATQGHEPLVCLPAIRLAFRNQPNSHGYS